MKKEMVLRPVSSGSEKYEVSRPSAFSAWKHVVLNSAPLLFLSRFYGRLLDMPVSSLAGFPSDPCPDSFFPDGVPVGYVRGCPPVVYRVVWPDGVAWPACRIEVNAS